MVVDVDEAMGQAVGSHIRLTGRVFGLRLVLDEVVTRRDPPTRKVWQTVDTPRLLVIGAYTMGVEITPESRCSRLRVFIEYDLPHGLTRVLGWLFADFYARWCVNQMIAGTSDRFRKHGPAEAPQRPSHSSTNV